ncbi:hypothetical protein PR202_gb29400 [Eleusine coracana subsp. coracana]|uniref:Uncharacterized protein n=1 Tax=Eleusine coracana subsp. coracana TaxID=191504 RepID=A0AAV5FZ79_ELECO|nr:hypothetical protein PR202_gb29400 [Eleusine coracana subsp. coracana]
MAAQPRLRATDSDDAQVAVPVLCCLLQDLAGAVAFLASHPLHAAYLLVFARHLAAVAAFFGPLLVSTALLLAALATVGGGADWPEAGSSSLCGVAVAALRAGLRPDGGGEAGLVAQLCFFVLGPGDATAVDRVGEITGDLCDITGSCFVSEEGEEGLLLLGGEECKEVAFALPLMDDAMGDSSFFFLDHKDSGEGKDEIDDKVVISEDLKSLAQQCYQGEVGFVQESVAEEEQVVGIQEQGLISSDIGDAIAEKRLECDLVSVEIKKCEPVQEMGMEVKKREPVQAIEMEIKKCEPVQKMEVKELQPVQPKGIRSREQVKPCSLIAQRIKLWEAQVSGSFNTVIEDKEDISVKFSFESKSNKDLKKCVPSEADPCIEKRDHKLKTQDVTSKKQSVEREYGQEFKDVKECVPSETETFSEIWSQDQSVEENAPASHTEQVPTDMQPEAEFKEQQCRAAQAEQDVQVGEPEQALQGTEEYKDVTESPVLCNERESSLKSTSIAGRVHSRTSSENLIGEGLPSQKEKEWKRTLACKLYEERMQLKLCRDRAVVEGSDNMDMLWEAYEVGGSGSGTKQGGIRVRNSKKVEELVEEDQEESGEQDDDDDEGSVRQLCCLQALKFSTKKTGFGGGKPSLAKISKVLKRMTALSRVGSRHSQKEP